MALIKPFRGVLYNSRATGDLSRIVAPPYDVISESMQKDFYALHPNNVVRIILGKIEKDDDGSNNRYTRANGFFHDWMQKDILVRHDAPSVYIYRQDYYFKGKLKARLGFISLMKIEDPHKSQVLPHEYTFAKPKADRLSLMKATEADLSPIFSLYDDKDSKITNILKDNISGPPAADVEQDGVRHRLWQLSDTGTIEKIKDHIKNEQVLIADGHHRYEVALNFRDHARSKNPERNEARDSDYVMMYFASLDPGALTILSTHRVVKTARKVDFTKTVAGLEKYFSVEKMAGKDEVFRRMETAAGGMYLFGMYHKPEGFFLLTLKDEKGLEGVIARANSYKWKYLDVSLLHQLVFDRVLKVKENVEKKKDIVYTKETDSAVRLVDEGDYDFSFFLNPPRIEQVRDVAGANDRMPHKTTYFYPKLLSGLVFYKMEDI